MKKIINAMVIAFTMMTIGNLDARAVRRSTIRITPNQKAMLTNTKALKNPSLTPEQKKQAEIQLAINLAKDKDAPLLLREQQLQEDIEAVKAEIKSMQEENGYLGLLFDNEELGQAKKDLKEFEKELFDVQRKLKREPKAVMSLKKWAMVSFIAAVGLAAADQLITGGAGRTAIWGYVPSASNVGTAGKTMWSYVPSLRSAPESSWMDILENAGTIASTAISTTGTLLAAYSYYNQLNDIIAGMNENPDADQEVLQNAIRERDLLKKKLDKFKETNPEEYKKNIKN